MIMPDEFTIPAGYQSLEPECERFFKDHPDYDRNVFIMCRFSRGDQLLLQTEWELRIALRSYGLVPLRADDKFYPIDGILWNNVCVYMICCKYGVAILEDRGRDELNPNVTLEYGFMRALNKPVLLLADRKFQNMRADIIGKMIREFDISNVADTIRAPVKLWLEGLDVGTGAALDRSVLELNETAQACYLRLPKIKNACNENERKDELWYFGEELARYKKLVGQNPTEMVHADIFGKARRVADNHDLSVIDELIDDLRKL